MKKLGDRLLFTLFVSLYGALVGLILLAVISIAIEFSGAPCRDTANKMGIPSEYAFTTGCMYQINGQWLPRSMVVATEKDGKIVFVPKVTESK